jgi:hypothetical protein
MKGVGSSALPGNEQVPGPSNCSVETTEPDIIQPEVATECSTTIVSLIPAPRMKLIIVRF